MNKRFICRFRAQTPENPAGWTRQDIYSILTILSPVTIFLFIILFNRDYDTNRRLSEISYKVNATQFRPVIKMIGTPVLKINYLLLQSSIIPNNLILDSTLYQKPDSQFIDFDVTFRIANTGNAIARVHTFINKFDTLSGTKSLRNKFLRNAYSHDRDSLRYIFPGDTLTIQRQVVGQNDNDAFVLHFLMLYENETDALYDTYYWAKYVLGVVVRIKAYPNRTFRIVLIGKEVENINLVKDHLSTKLYTNEEADSIRTQVLVQ